MGPVPPPSSGKEAAASLLRGQGEKEGTMPQVLVTRRRSIALNTVSLSFSAPTGLTK